MAVQLTVDSLDGVGEDLKPVYVEADGGKFVLDPDKYAETKKKGVLAKNSELLGKLKKEQDALKRFEALKDFDDEALTALLESRNGNGKPPDAEAAKAENERAAAKAAKKHADEKAALAAENETLKKQIRYFQLTVPLKEVAIKAGVFPEEVELVIYDSQKYFKLDDNGKIVVLDEDGDVAEMTPLKWFTDVYKERRPRLFAATGAGGSGATGGSVNTGSGPKTVKRSQWDAMTTSERTKLSKDGGKVLD